jgi:hypothetical protein
MNEDIKKDVFIKSCSGLRQQGEASWQVLFALLLLPTTGSSSNLR